MTPQETYGPLGPGMDEAFPPGTNVRELGGYRVAGGRTVRHRLLWRSCALGWLGKAQRQALEARGIRQVLDLRSSQEARDMPDPKLEGASNERICAMLDARGDEVNFSPEGIGRIIEAHREAKAAGALTAAGAVGFSDEALAADPALEAMGSLYVGMAFGNRAFQRLFAHLEAGEAPILFHCTMGKDRTGVAAMLVLLALGASEEDALFDYLLTNAYLEDLIRGQAAQDLGVSLDQVPDEIPEQSLTRMGVSERMGRAVLAGIHDRYDSLEDYFRGEYGLDQARLAALRERYTE